MLTPWRPFGAALDVDPRPGRAGGAHRQPPEDLADLLGASPDARFVLEQLTSMRRHGMTRPRAVGRRAERCARAPGAGLGGVALHLPLGATAPTSPR